MLDFDDLPTVPSAIGIAENVLQKHPGLDEIFKKALLGDLPRGRALKTWEPERLNETHLQIILLRAGGMRQRDIAAFLNSSFGLKLSDSSVSIICNHPDAVYILSHLVSYAADNIMDLSTRIKAYASEALDGNIQIMRTTNDKKLAARIGFDLLDRAGYGGVQKNETQHTTTIVVQAGAANNLAEALRETRQEVQGSFVMAGDKQLSGEGSGNSLVPSESAGDSGQPLASVPPTSASLSPKVLAKRRDLDDEADFRAVREAEGKPARKTA